MKNVTIKKNFGNSSDSVKFGSTYYTLTVNNCEWSEEITINCSNNEQFIKGIEDIRLMKPLTSYVIINKEVSKFAMRSRFSHAITIKATFKGIRNIQGSYSELLKIKQTLTA